MCNLKVKSGRTFDAEAVTYISPKALILYLKISVKLDVEQNF